MAQPRAPPRRRVRYVDGADHGRAQRDADRTALRRSCDQLAALAGDINALIRLIRLAKGAEAARQFGDRMRGLEADVRQHIDLASRLVAHPEDQS